MKSTVFSLADQKIFIIIRSTICIISTCSWSVSENYRSPEDSGTTAPAVVCGCGIVWTPKIIIMHDQNSGPRQRVRQPKCAVLPWIPSSNYNKVQLLPCFRPYHPAQRLAEQLCQPSGLWSVELRCRAAEILHLSTTDSTVLVTWCTVSRPPLIPLSCMVWYRL